MTQDDGRFAHVVQIAYQLAQTGELGDSLRSNGRSSRRRAWRKASIGWKDRESSVSLPKFANSIPSDALMAHPHGVLMTLESMSSTTPRGRRRA